jgi:hypothetical protein
MLTTSCNNKHLFIFHTTYLCVSFFTAEGCYFIQYQAWPCSYKGYISRKRSHVAKVSAVIFSICIPSVHHQEFFTVQTAVVYVIQVCCVYSEKLLMMDRGMHGLVSVNFLKHGGNYVYHQL